MIRIPDPLLADPDNHLRQAVVNPEAVSLADPESGPDPMRLHIVIAS